MTASVPLGPRTALVDTSAFGALIVARDTNHATACAIRSRLATQRWRLITTNYVLAETHALLLAREGRRVALDGLRGIDRGGTVVVQAEAADEQAARAILERYRDKSFTLTDAMSFAIMGRLGIVHAFTFDHHFVQYGVTLLELSGLSG